MHPSHRPIDLAGSTVVPLGRMTFGRREALGALDALSMPTLVATGANDKARLPDEGRRMAERLGCPFALIPDAGHIASLEAPDSVNRLLLDFLATPSVQRNLR